MNEGESMEHMMVVELQDAFGGYRFWSRPMPESQVQSYIERNEFLDWPLSDIDHAAKCWCQTPVLESN